MILHSTRTVAAQVVQPGSTIEHPDTGALLLVDATTRTREGLELACFPSTRVEGKRIVLRPDPTDMVQEVADYVTRRRLLAEFAGAVNGRGTTTIEARADAGGSIELSWPDGWVFTLAAGEPSWGGPAEPHEPEADEPVTGEPEGPAHPDAIEASLIEENA
jgi:hypothetical protein